MKVYLVTRNPFWEEEGFPLGVFSRKKFAEKFADEYKNKYGNLMKIKEFELDKGSFD